MAYVLDTNIFNRLLDGKLQLDKLPSDGRFIASYVQYDELCQTKDVARRDMLLAKFSEIAPRIQPTETFLADISRTDIDKLGDGVLCSSIRDDLDARNKSRKSNPQDALIGEVAIKNDFTLITTDKDLAEVVKKHGGKFIFFE